MSDESANFYLLCELCDVLVPKYLSEFLERKMTMSKNVKGYKHTKEWWIPNEARLSRAPPKGTELVAFRREDPDNWGMNLLIKVLKYSSYKLLERNGKEWNALDVLIKARKDVTARGSTGRIDQGNADSQFLHVTNAFGDLDLLEAIAEMRSLKDEVLKQDELKENKFYKNLRQQDTEWKDFEDKLYERYGKPTLEKLRNFRAKQKPINIIQQMAPHYNSFGPKMLQDDNGAIVEGIREAKLGNPVKTTEAILSQWLESAEATWDQLLECLRHSELNVLAQDVEEVLIYN